MNIDNPRPQHYAPPFVSGVLDVAVVRDGPVGVVVFVRGDLDRAAIPPLTRCLREILDLTDRGGTVVLNLTGTDFVDLGGLRFLTKATERAAARDVRLYLAGCSTHLVRLLHLTDLVDEVNLIASRQP
jgi:anti-anti-sigma factor